MIVYATHTMMQAYRLNPPEQLQPSLLPFAMSVIQRERGDPMRAWGASLFLFRHRPCIQLMHFPSKLTLYLFDVSSGDLKHLNYTLSRLLLCLYRQDGKMTEAIEHMFSADRHVVFAPLKNKVVQATLNRTHWQFAALGDRFAQYFDCDHVIHATQINHDVNFEFDFNAGSPNAAPYHSAEHFRAMVLQHYGAIAPVS